VTPMGPILKRTREPSLSSARILSGQRRGCIQVPGRARSAAVPRKRAAIDELAPGLVAEVGERVRKERAVAAKKLVPDALTRRAEAELVEALARKGLEHTGKWIRVPIAEQLDQIVNESPAPIGGIAKRVRGASAAEVKHAIAEVLKQRRAIVVMKGGKEHLAPKETPVLREEELDRLAELKKELDRLLRAAKTPRGKPKRMILREELRLVLERFDSKIEAPVDVVLHAIEELEDPALPLVRIPELARRLEGKLARQALHEALFAAERDHRLELRPESGVQLLSPEDAALCPRGPSGAVLSYARRVEVGG
jgi:hypothetical protein